MSLVLVTAPALEPVTLQEAKDDARVDGSDDDALIDALIVMSREQVENTTHRALITQTWDWAMDGFPRWFELPKPPLQSITSIKYIDDSGVEQTLAASSYRVDSASEPGRITPAWGESWPSTRSVTGAVTVRFVAGYGTNPSDVPESLRLALRRVLNHNYEHREPVLVGTSQSELPFGLRAILGQYTVPVGF